MPAAPASAEVLDGTEGATMPDNNVSRSHRAATALNILEPAPPQSADPSAGDTLQLALLAGPPETELARAGSSAPTPPVPLPSAPVEPQGPIRDAPAALRAADAAATVPAMDAASSPEAVPPILVPPTAAPPAPVKPAAPAALPPAVKPAATRAPAIPRSAAQPSAVNPPRPRAVPATPPRMDRQFIAQNNIVERYLTGRLPPRGVQDFERYCRDHPQLLDELRLADHLHAALRLLEAGGHAPPWEEKPQRWWEKLPVLIGACGLCVVLAALWLGQSARLSAQQRHTAALEQQLAGQPLDPVESTRGLHIRPDTSGSSPPSIATIGGDRAELADLTIDLSWSRYRAFNVIIDRVGQGRVAILHNLLRDSNGNLRIELNSSALGPGDYRLSIDGLTWSGAPVAQAWATITVARHAEDP